MPGLFLPGRVELLVTAALLSLAGCQSLLGFEEFSEELSEQRVQASESDAASANLGDSGLEPKGPNGEGDRCATDEDCGGDFKCLFSRCRSECDDETDCASGSVCLDNGAGRGGCRVASEASCENGKCDNAQLVCGLDDSCRVECGEEKSCDSPTQVCVAGSCVSTIGDDAQLFDCGAVGTGEVACDGGRLVACNSVLGPGLVLVAACESAAVCDSSLPSDGLYTEERPILCGAVCLAGENYCDGETLHACKQDGSGPVGAGEDCATTALCKQAIEEALSECPAPACDADETRCAGGQTELEAQRCNTGRTGFDTTDICDQAGLQCSPSSATCVSLAIDVTEVSQAAYLAWLAGSPATAAQLPGCGWNSSFEQPPGCLPSACDAVKDDACPAVCVDWCDATAYCTAQGKRLCGKIGGGMVSLERHDDPGVSEWMNGCSAGGQFTYGHGSDAPETEPSACRFAGNSSGSTYAGGTHSVCASPGRNYTQLFDMSGNVAEWENACERSATSDEAKETDVCLARGGSYESELEEIRCAKVPVTTLTRESVSAAVGFRCCAD